MQADLKSNLKKFFSFIKNKRNENIAVSPLSECTSLKRTKQYRAGILNNQFSSVFSVENKTIPNVQGPQGDTAQEINIITKLLNNLALSKTRGTNIISARFWMKHLFLIMFYPNNMKLQAHTDYKLHEIKKGKTGLNRTQNLLKVMCRLK